MSRLGIYEGPCRPHQAEHLPLLDGLTLDWQKQGLNESFKFVNPNVKAQCGCGESFAV